MEMSETEEQRKARGLRELEGKNVAHYSVMLSTWIETRMERDKTLVTLSAAAIGLLVTILTTVGVSSYAQMSVVAISFVGFITCIVSALIIYQLNAEHIQSEIREESCGTVKLKRFDKLSFWSFAVGAIALVFFGLLNAYQFLEKEEGNMAEKESKTTVSTPALVKKSVEGIGALRPQNTDGSSSGGQNNQGAPSQNGNTNGENKG